MKVSSQVKNIIRNGGIKHNFLTESAVDSSYNSDKVTFDEHCYECKVRFRDPKPKDLMMFLHAWRYKV